MGHRVLIQTLYSAGPSHWLHSHLALLRYEISITLPSFTHYQSRMTSQQPEACWEKLKLQWEKKWKTAEHYDSDELKWYSSSVSLQEESACIQHPPHTVLLNGWEAISFLRANTQLWTVKMLISVTLSFFFFSICLHRNKCNMLQEHFAVDDNAATPSIWLIHWQRSPAGRVQIWELYWCFCS